MDDVAIHYVREYLNERGVLDSSREPLFTHIRGDKTKALMWTAYILLFGILPEGQEWTGESIHIYSARLLQLTFVNVAVVWTQQENILDMRLGMSLIVTIHIKGTNMWNRYFTIMWRLYS